MPFNNSFSFHGTLVTSLIKVSCCAVLVINCWHFLWGKWRERRSNRSLHCVFLLTFFLIVWTFSSLLFFFLLALRLILSTCILLFINFMTWYCRLHLNGSKCLSCVKLILKASSLPTLIKFVEDLSCCMLSTLMLEVVFYWGHVSLSAYLSTLFRFGQAMSLILFNLYILPIFFAVESVLQLVVE